MLRTKVVRTGKFTPIPREARNIANRTNCQICHRRYGKIAMEGARMVYPKQVLDHGIPRRFLEQHAIYEHYSSNLLSICNFCHGKKKSLEDRLFQGDTLSFLQGLNRMGYPLQRVITFAASVGLKEFMGWNL